jgi:hypothetical protein
MGPLFARTLVGLELILASCLALVSAASCGSRTGLAETEGPDAAGERAVASPDRFVEEPAEDDVDSERPGLDASRPDAPLVRVCPDAAVNLIYLIGSTDVDFRTGYETYVLATFDPSTYDQTVIGPLSCLAPGIGVDVPVSLAVDREGVAYVSAQRNGELYRVSTTTAACTPTAYDASSNGGAPFPMAFVADVGDGGAAREQLFIAANDGGALATLDTTTFEVTSVGMFDPAFQVAGLTGTGDGRLYAYSASDLELGQVDPSTASVVAQQELEVGYSAFAFWGGDFYVFGPSDGTMGSTLAEVDPSGDEIPMGALTAIIVYAAGVSTCAPKDRDGG